MRWAALGAAWAVAALAAGPAMGEERSEEAGPFGGKLEAPRLAPERLEQDPPLPDTCDMPPRDGDAFKALGRNPGPPAVAHHSGGREIGSPALAKRAPFPQLFPTGDYAIEPNIGVTASGAVFVDALRCGSAPGIYQPIVLRSTDEGQSFHDVSPRIGGQYSHPLTEDPYLYVDKRTNRVFSTDIDTVVACQPLSFSDDDGKTWTETQTGCSLADHANIFTGPPPPGGEAPAGYPNVWYYCAIDGGAMAEVSKATGCVKSTDGGMTSARTGDPAYVADPEITAANPTQCDGGTGPGFVDSSGTVYLPRGWCGQPYLAISHDEGGTWERMQVSDLGMGTQNDDATINNTAYNHEAGVRVDSAGNILYVWVAHDRLPYLTISRDAGKTWSTPKMFGPPGVRQAWNPVLDMDSSGRIAVGYLASTNAPGAPFADGPEDLAPYKDATWNGYITLADDPLSAEPTFYTASVNAPSHPFLKLRPDASGTATIPCAQVRCGQEYDFIDLKIARDGTPWAIFIDACGGGKDCISPGFGEAVAARLVRPASGPAASLPPARRCVDRRKFSFRLHHARRARVVNVQVYVNGRLKVTRRGRDIKRVTIKRLPKKHFKVRIVSTQSTGSKLVSTRTYRRCKKGRPHTRGIHRRR